MTKWQRGTAVAATPLLAPTLTQAADKMKRLDIGAIPVRENDRLVGMITDRDSTVRAVAEGRDPRKVPVREAMSREVCFCYDESVESAATLIDKFGKHEERLRGQGRRLFERWLDLH